MVDEDHHDLALGLDDVVDDSAIAHAVPQVAGKPPLEGSDVGVAAWFGAELRVAAVELPLERRVGVFVEVFLPTW